jgi:tripartite-type tricarboxylate transporter receptor subunit TctC
MFLFSPSRAACALCLAALAVFNGPAAAQATSKQLRLVVPFPPGGTVDSIARNVADYLHQKFGVVVVENRAGANGNIGADNVYRSPPDGTTLLFAPYGPIAVNKNLYPKLSYDPAQWVPVTMLATVPNVLTVHPSLPVKNLSEFIAYLKANPGKVAFASQGSGSSSHLAAELFMQLSKTEMIHVPYKGTGPALNDLLGGQVTVFFDTLSSSGKFHKNGRLRVLAVAGTKRSSALPEVPTFAEAGPASMKQMVSSAWYAVVAAPQTPPAIVSKYEKAITEMLALPETQRKFTDMGIEPVVASSEQTGAFIRDETEKWGKVIREGKISVE